MFLRRNYSRTVQDILSKTTISVETAIALSDVVSITNIVITSTLPEGMMERCMVVGEESSTGGWGSGGDRSIRHLSVATQ
jgi:hypothetical protein